MKISLKNIAANLGVSFTDDGCLIVPDVTSGMRESAVNDELLRTYGALLRGAQTPLDQIPTSAQRATKGYLCAAAPNPELEPETSVAERKVFEKLYELNAEVVLRILVMRGLVTAALTRR